jgi:hypothetical protein
MYTQGNSLMSSCRLVRLRIAGMRICLPLDLEKDVQTALDRCGSIHGALARPAPRHTFGVCGARPQHCFVRAYWTAQAWVAQCMWPGLVDGRERRGRRRF